MRVTPFTASTFRSDGGAMFGLVPKPLWAKLIEPDASNAIPQNANALFLELDDGRKGLVDTGCGPEALFSEKELRLNGMGPGWPLADFLARHGTDRAAVDFVVLTHLHWDHAGGVRDEEAGLAFPNAVHYVHALEWEDALSGDPLLHHSYPREIVAPLSACAAEQVALVRADDEEIFPGLRMVRSGGHTRGHCVVVIESENLVLEHPRAASIPALRKLVFAADVCPTHHHFRLVFQTAYDTYPLATRAWKQKVLPRLAEEGAVLLFDHDPELYGATLAVGERGRLAVDTPFPVSV